MRAQVTALACSLPRSHGVPLARWSRVELARHVATVPALPTIEARTIGRWLEAEQIHPWRYHSWQHIQEPEAFRVRARPVLRLYEQATSLLEQGIWVVCTDEKTRVLRARGRTSSPSSHPSAPRVSIPTLSPSGSIALDGRASVWPMGWSMASVIHANAKSPFALLRETVILAEARRRGVQTVALVLDNGSTHVPKQLPRWIQELATMSEGKLTMQLSWLPTNASWLDQLEIWFSLLQRKLLQPNHFCSLDELEQAIHDFITRSNQTAKPLKWSYTVEQLEHKLATRLRGNVAA